MTATLSTISHDDMDMMTRNGATAKQVYFYLKLAGERGFDADDRLADGLIEKIVAKLIEQPPTRRDISRWIDELLRSPKRVITPTVSTQRSTEVDAELTPGVYEVDNVVYVVKFNQSKTRLYAKRLVEINADRLTESDDVVQIDFEYDRGAIWTVKPEHRMPLERAEKLAVRYGRCLNCGRHLKAAKSVRQGIGPVCIKAFRVN